MTIRIVKRTLSIDIGGTNIKGALINSEGKVLLKKTIKTNAHSNLETILKNISKTIEGVNETGVVGIGVGVPGFINSKTNILEAIPNIPELVNFNLKKFIEDKFQLPVFIDNDANNAIRGEFIFGSPIKNHNHFMFITVGTGVGAGLILNKKLHKGASSFGGEFGHSIFLPNGRQCTCGKYGCIEAYASATAIMKEVRNLYSKIKELNYSSLLSNYDLELIEAKLVFDLAKRGDLLCQNIVDEVARALGTGIASILNVLALDHVTIGGQISLAGNTLLQPLLLHVFRNTLPQILKACTIELSQLGNDAGLYGGAVLSMPELDKEGIFV